MRRNRRGFTLIELMVVISIISLLSSIVLASVKTVRMKARDARRKEDLHNIYTALHLYYDEKGYLPHTFNNSNDESLDGDSDCGTWDYSNDQENNGINDPWLKFLEPYFGGAVPRDPINEPCLTNTPQTPQPPPTLTYRYHCYDTENTLSLSAQMESPAATYWKAQREPGWKCKMP